MTVMNIDDIGVWYMQRSQLLHKVAKSEAMCSLSRRDGRKCATPEQPTTGYINAKRHRSSLKGPNKERQLAARSQDRDRASKVQTRY